MINLVPSPCTPCVSPFRDRLGGEGPGALVEAGWRGYRDMGGGENVACRAPAGVHFGGGGRHGSVTPGRGRHRAPGTGGRGGWGAAALTPRYSSAAGVIAPQAPGAMPDGVLAIEVAAHADAQAGAGAAAETFGSLHGHRGEG